MTLEMLRDEYDLARRYTQRLYADLPEADVYWRPAPKSSGIGWHLGLQAAISHFLVRHLLAAEPSETGGHWTIRHFLIYIDGAGAYEVAAEGVEWLPEEASS